MRRLILFIEGEGEADAVPTLVRRLLTEQGDWHDLLLDDRLNPPQATRLQPVVRRVSPVGLQPVPLSRRSGVSKRVMIIVNDP
jgi:hypothetical protein